MERGTVWWKEKWIDTFAAIDGKNRLKGGRGDGGSVTALEIDGQAIRARVVGPGRTPHRVRISLPPFGE
ncbi:MAG: hypothetical protein LBB14_02545, partial [Puniceicoccales bacterium]|nr:hypothetical protein [Puniceicoccales bacterium]